MPYDDARSRIATVLATISITVPLTASIERVYTDPPATLQDLPCFVMYGAEGEYDWTADGAAIAEEVETERFQLFIHDADLDRAANIVRGFQVATRNAFKTEPGLGGHAVVRRLRWGRPTGLRYAGNDTIYTGCDFFIEFLPLVP